MTTAKPRYDEWTTPEGLILLKGWKRDGLTDKQIAHNIGINVATLYRWKDTNSEICNALKKGREVADYEVVNALFKRATGYEYNKKIAEIEYAYKTDEQGNRTRVEIGRTERITVEQVAPDTGAAIYWTKNRMADRWRDKPVDTMDEEAIAKLKEALAGVHSAID